MLDFNYPESDWERVQRQKREREERAHAKAEQMRSWAYGSVVVMFQSLSRGGQLTPINLHSRNIREVFRKQPTHVLAELIWTSTAGKFVAEVLIQLRQEGVIGIVGFSGYDVPALLRFIRRNPNRLDVRIFPGIVGIKV